MGIFEEKYTKEYFTGKSCNGDKLDYGVTQQIDENGFYTIRQQDEEILKKLSFSNKNILYLGFGRGEEIVYGVEQGAKFCTGVDFSQNALDIAQEHIQSKNICNVQLIKKDALQFVKDCLTTNKIEESQKFDIVIMLDFIEHLPRTESEELISNLHKITSEKCIIAINTPCYKFDNDVLSNGFDSRNNENCLDTSDTNPNTIGMHCNKFTIISLQKHMNMNGFINVTEAHYFVKNDNVYESFAKIAYSLRWKYLFDQEYPINEKFENDIIEYPYSDGPEVKEIAFTEGLLNGIKIFTTENYKKSVYKNGDYDIEVMLDSKTTISKKDQITIFDVGGFVGINSLLYAKEINTNSKVISFEPNPYNRNRMLKNFSLNPNYNFKVFVESFGFGTENSNVEMVMSSDIDNGPSSTSRIVGSHPKITDKQLPSGFFSETASITTLDNYVDNSKEIPDIIKIDVEGAEFLVLKGSIQTLLRHKPLLYIELHSEYCTLLCTTLLLSIGYDIGILKEEEDNRLTIKATHKNIDIDINNIQLEKYFSLLENTGFLIKVVAQLSASNDKYSIINSNFEKEITDYKKQNKSLEDQLTIIQNSASWKVTKPLRILKNLFFKH